MPVEPTPKQIGDGIRALMDAPDLGGIVEPYLPEVVDAYKAMLTSAPPAPSVGGWRRIEEDAEVDVPLDTDLLLAWWDEWSEAWKIEANYAGSERGGWRHGRATHWMELPHPPKEKP